MADASPWRNHLERHAEKLVWGCSAAATVLRARTAATTFLVPDEALHFTYVNQPSFAATYAASLHSAHPPLFFLLLHLVRLLASSELALRSISLVSCFWVPWLLFRWISTVSNRSTALSCGILAAFAPPLMLLGGVVRHYGLLLVFASAALFLCESGFARRSRGRLAAASLMLALAALTHYSAVWLILALGLYALVRFAKERLPPGLAVTWALGQVGILGIYAFLYRTQISKVRGGTMERFAVEVWLRDSYFKGGSRLHFAAARTVDVFHYLSGDTVVGWVGLLLFATALALKGRVPKAFRALLLMPFLAVGIAALAGLFPYGGTRHDVILLPFALAGIAVALDSLSGLVPSFVFLGPLLAAAIAGLGNWGADPAPGEIPPGEQDKSAVQKALALLRASLAPGDLVFTDAQTNVELAYYLAPEGPTPFSPEARGVMQARWGGLNIIQSPMWAFTPFTLGPEFARARLRLGLPPAARVRVLIIGWPPHLLHDLAIVQPGAILSAQELSPYVALFELNPAAALHAR